MAYSCSCGREFKTPSGLSWHKGRCEKTSKKRRAVSYSVVAKPPKSRVRLQKDVASDVILVATSSSYLFDPPNAPFVAFATSFDGDIKGGRQAVILPASSLEDAKKKAEAAWKAGKFGKAGDPFWAESYKHSIGKGWYEA